MKTEKKKGKKVSSSLVEMTQMVLPNDTNRLGNLLGGRLMEWIDICAAIACQRHTNRVCVTAAVDELVFLHPIRQGDVVTLRSSVNRVFSSSMEVGVHVTVEDPIRDTKKKSNKAYLTFVCLGDDGKPMKVQPVIPVSGEERRRYRDAGKRREHRLKVRKQIGRR